MASARAAGFLLAVALTLGFQSVRVHRRYRLANEIRAKIHSDRALPRWQHYRPSFLRFAADVGHNLAHERACPIIDWIGHLTYPIVPRLKLAFCLQAKVASSNFKDLINALNGLEAAKGFGVGDCGASMWINFNISELSITRENGWRFASFFHDPLERYVAVFGSSCVPKTRPDGVQEYEHGGFECCGELVPTGGVHQEAVRSSFERRVLFDAANGLPMEDQHWSPQVQLLHNCGWGKFDPAKLDYRGDISRRGGGGVSEQVREMLSMVNATNADMQLADRFFPSSSIAGHRNQIATDYESFYRRKDVARAVRSLYAADYQLIAGVGKAFTDELDVSA